MSGSAVKKTTVDQRGEDNCMQNGIPSCLSSFQGYLQFWKQCLFVNREKGLFLSVYVDDVKLAGKKQSLDPMWKVLNKEVDVGETNVSSSTMCVWLVLKENVKLARIL